MTLTSPVNNIAYTIVFFAAFFTLLASLGYFLTYLRRGKITPKSRVRILIVSTFIMLVLMFRSAQSLSWADALVLLLVAAGLLFYSSRRTA